jgi:hypothetical protein
LRADRGLPTEPFAAQFSVPNFSWRKRITKSTIKRAIAAQTLQDIDIVHISDLLSLRLRPSLAVFHTNISKEVFIRLHNGYISIMDPAFGNNGPSGRMRFIQRRKETCIVPDVSRPPKQAFFSASIAASG